MVTFYISIAALIVLALLFIVPVMLKQQALEKETFDEENINIAKERLAELKQEKESGRISAEEYVAEKLELEKTLAVDLSINQYQESVTNSSKSMAIALVLFVPVVSILIYSQIGSFNSLNAEPQQAQTGTQPPEPQMSLEEAIAKLKDRLDKEPNNPEGWFMLARTYAATNEFAKAVPAYEKVIELVGENDADLLLRYADAVAMTEGGRLAGAAYPIVTKALAIAPDHPQGLWMVGMAYSQRGEFENALENFYKVMPMLQDPQSSAEMSRMIAVAESNLSPDVVNKIKAKQPIKSAKPVGVEITVNVRLDDSLKDKVSPNDTVFIFARAVSGPPMPVAAIRRTVGDLPTTVALSDAMAMMPSLKLSQFDEVTIGAKISKSGTAGPAPGDLLGEMSPVKVVAGQSVDLVINQVR